MKSLKSYARFLELFCIVAVIPVMIISLFLKWFGRAIPLYNTVSNYVSSMKDGVRYIYQVQAAHVSILPMPSRILGFLADGVSVALFVYGCLYFIRVLRCYQRGEIFSDNTLYFFTRVSKAAFAWTLYNPINYMLLSVITTMYNPVGQREIAIAFGSHDIMNIFIVGCFWMITSLMHEGYSLKKDQDLTV